MKTHTIWNFPLPLSENACYGTDWKTKRRFASKGLKVYQGHVQVWALKNSRLIDDITQSIEAWIIEKPFNMIRLDVWLYFDRKRLVTKDGRLKRIDSANFIKPLQDSLTSILGIDDKYFDIGTISKRVAKESERVVIQIEPWYLADSDSVRVLV